MKRKYTFTVGAWMACASLTTTALFPQAAYAQEAGANDKLAQTRFDQGKAAFKKKKYEAARKALLDAYQLAPTDETALYLGLASVKAKKYGDGARYLQKYLAANQGTSSPEHDQAEAALAEATKKLGTIEVLAPRGTEVYLDGNSDKSGVAPMEQMLVEPGAHSVRGRTADGATLVEEVKVKVGEKVTAKLGDPNANPAPVVEDKNEKAFDEKPKEEKKKSGPGLFSPPKTLVPVVVALGVTGVGLAGVLVFGLSRNNAQNAANDIDAAIRTEATKRNESAPGICASTNTTLQAHYGNPCARLSDTRDATGRNALLTNVSIGVAGVAAVAALALYLFLPKRDDRPPPKKTEEAKSSFRLDGFSPIRFDNKGQGVGVIGRF